MSFEMHLGERVLAQLHGHSKAWLLRCQWTALYCRIYNIILRCLAARMLDC